MVKSIRKRKRKYKYPKREKFVSKKRSFPFNIDKTDRISYSIRVNNNRKIIKIENISYEVNIKDKWEWVLRYDDHGGIGQLHLHIRISLKNDKSVELPLEIQKSKNKEFELSWACADIKSKYKKFKKELLENEGLDTD